MAGLYLTAALLEIFSNSLTTQSGTNIRTFFSNINSGVDKWFLLLPLVGLSTDMNELNTSNISNMSSNMSSNTSTNNHSSSTSNNAIELNWTAFVCGWMHSAAG